jgi:protein TonB
VLHAGVLSSNLLHIDADSAFSRKDLSVRLHIVPAARVPAAPRKKSAVKKMPKTDTLVADGPIPSDSVNARSVKNPALKSVLPAETPRPPVKLQTPDPVPAPRSDDIRRLYEIPPEEESAVKVKPVLIESAEQPAENRAVPAGIAKAGNPFGKAVTDSLSALASAGTGNTGGFGGAAAAGESDASIPGLSDIVQYPRYSRLHKQEGTTELSVEILAAGMLGKIEIVHSSGYSRLDQAAIKAVRKAEPVPAKKDGRNVTSVARIYVKFVLEDGEE